jgi:hypothetical protein
MSGVEGVVERDDSLVAGRLCSQASPRGRRREGIMEGLILLQSTNEQSPAAVHCDSPLGRAERERLSCEETLRTTRRLVSSLFRDLRFTDSKTIDRLCERLRQDPEDFV